MPLAPPYLERRFRFPYKIMDYNDIIGRLFQKPKWNRDLV
jgi:hypothetical protein